MPDRYSSSARDARWGNNPGDGRLIPDGPRHDLARGDLGDALDRWHQALAGRVARGDIGQATFQQYRRLSLVWGAWCNEHRRTSPSSGDVARFLQGKSGHTAFAYRTILSSFYRWAQRHAGLADIVADIPPPKAPAVRTTPGLSAVQVRTLLKTVGGTDLRARRDRAMIAVLFQGALEPISLHRAKRRDLDLEAGRLRHQPRGHRCPDVTIALGAHTSALLRTYVDHLGKTSPTAPLFPATPGRSATLTYARPLSTLSIRLLVRRVMDAAYGGHPAVDAPALGRGSGRQRPASRAVRRSALAILARRLGPDQASAFGDAGNPSRFRHTIDAIIPITDHHHGRTAAR